MKCEQDEDGMATVSEAAAKGVAAVGEAVTLEEKVIVREAVVRLCLTMWRRNDNRERSTERGP